VETANDEAASLHFQDQLLQHLRISLPNSSSISTREIITENERISEEELDEMEMDIYIAGTAMTKPIITASVNGHSVTALMDTGASLSLVYSDVIQRLGISVDAGRKTTLRMADASSCITKGWATVPLMVTGLGVVNIQAVVMPTKLRQMREFDLIVGRPEQKTLFGDVTFSADDRLIAEKDGKRTVLPIASYGALGSQVASVELDADGEQSLTKDETLAQCLELARESLKAANVQESYRPWLQTVIDQLPGLVRKNVIPAVAVDERLRSRAPRATIVMKDGAKLPQHQPTLMSPRLKAVLKDIMEDLRAGGLVTETTGEIATKVHLIPKPNGSGELRLVCDYRDLNVGVVRDVYALPRIESCLQLFSGKRIFSKLDLKSFFFQIPLEEESRKYVTITTGDNLYAWNVMPQGLTTSPAVAQRFIDWVLGKHGSLDGTDLKEVCTAYIDDIGVASSTIEEHQDAFKKILQRLHMHGIQLRFDKSDFFVTQMSFLGFLIDASSDPHATLVRPNPSKLAPMLNFERPTSPESLRRFLGMINFMHHLIEGHAATVSPLHELLTVEWDESTWTEVHTQAFEGIKRALASDPFVALPNESDPFVLRLDASHVCLGGALLQRTAHGEKVIAYISRKFNATEQRWTAAERELYALVYAIKKYGYLIIGSVHPVTFVSDHRPLQYYRTWTLTDKISRWMDVLNTIEWRFEYTRGDDNLLADALSRPDGIPKAEKQFVASKVSTRTQSLCESICSLREDDDDDETYAISVVIGSALDAAEDDLDVEHDHNRLVNDTMDAHYQCLVELVDERPTESEAINVVNALTDYDIVRDGSLNDIPMLSPQFLQDVRNSYEDDEDNVKARLGEDELVPDFHLKTNGFIFRTSVLPTPDAPPVLYIPRKAVNLWSKVLRAYHEDVAMHASATKTFHKIARRWFWPGMELDVKKWVKGCDICQRARPTTHKHYLPMAFPTPTRCFQIMAMDQKTDLPTDRYGYNSFVVCVDFLSRLAILIPCKKTTKALELQKLLHAHVYCKWGFPSKVVTDRGSVLASKLKELLKRDADVEHIVSTAGNPKTAAIAERAIRTSLEYLRKFVSEHAQGHPQAWSEALPSVEFAYNDSVNPRTYPYTPFMIAHGREPTHAIQGDVERFFPCPGGGVNTTVTGTADAWDNYADYLNLRKDVIHTAKENYRKLSQQFLETQRKKFGYFVPFKVGDLVWLTDVRLKNEVKAPSLNPKRFGPFEISEVLPHNDYLLRVRERDRHVPDELFKTQRYPDLSTPINGERLQRYVEPYAKVLGLDNTDFENDLLIGDSPDFENNARSLDMSLVAPVTRSSISNSFRPLIILDMGCGEKSLGRGIVELFGNQKNVRYISIDVDPKTEPTYCWNLYDFFQRRTETLETESLFSPGVIDWIWFSGRCDPFSQANTRGARDIEEGLRLIEQGLRIIDFLKAKVVFMESSNSGSHCLAKQPRMLEWEKRYGLQQYHCTQCKYGFLNMKPTCIWSNIPLTLQCCSRDNPCETLLHYRRHLVTSQNGPTGPEREIPGLSRRLSGRVAPGLIQLCLHCAFMHSLLI